MKAAWCLAVALLAGTVQVHPSPVPPHPHHASPITGTASTAPPATRSRTLADFGMVVVTEPPYSCKGDGVADDTACLQRAVTELAGHQFSHRTLFFPKGTYLVSDALVWGQASYFTMLGVSAADSVIRLRDGAGGFNNISAPRPVLSVPKLPARLRPAHAAANTTTATAGSRWSMYAPDDGVKGGDNMAFHTFVVALGIDTGRNNPGAVGLEYIGSNVGAVRNVTITTTGSAACGLSMRTPWPGPLLINRLNVVGPFQTAICVSEVEYGVTLQHISLSGFTHAGIETNLNPLFVRNLTTVAVNSSAMAVHMTSAIGSATVVDATHTVATSAGGGSGAPRAPAAPTVAYHLASSASLFLRNASAPDYDAVVGLAPELGKHVDEYASLGVLNLTAAPLRSLALEPVAPPETPMPTVPGADLDEWAVAEPWVANSLATALQQGKPYVWVVPPNNTFNASYAWLYFNETIVVPPTVCAVVNNFQTHRLAKSWGGRVGDIIRVEEGSGEASTAVAPPLILQSMMVYTTFVNTSGLTGLHWASARAPVYRDTGGINTVYDKGHEPSTLFYEDVAMAGDQLFTAGQRVYTTQFNPEEHHGHTTPLVTCDGCQLLILGHKTEGPVECIRLLNGAAVEVLGSLYYPVHHPNASTPIFSVDASSRLSASFLQTGGYNTLVNQTLANGTIASLTTSNAPHRGGGSLVSLFVAAPAH